MEPPHEQPPFPPNQPPRPPHETPAFGYQSPGAMQPPAAPGGLGFLWLFLIGAVGGAAVSAVAWLAGFNAIVKGSSISVLIVVIPVVKLGAGITLLCFRRWRGLGAGIMVSIALGFLIFFGTCMTHITG